jgi:hypothetical protein
VWCAGGAPAGPTRLRNDFESETNENGRFGRLALRKGLEKQVGDGGLSRTKWRRADGRKRADLGD